jgi:hypothetical protein
MPWSPPVVSRVIHTSSNHTVTAVPACLEKCVTALLVFGQRKAIGRATIWKPSRRNNPIPAGFESQAARTLKLNIAIRECRIPQPGQGIPKRNRTKQKCGSRTATGTSNKIKRADNDSARWRRRSSTILSFAKSQFGKKLISMFLGQLS